SGSLRTSCAHLAALSTFPTRRSSDLGRDPFFAGGTLAFVSTAGAVAAADAPFEEDRNPSEVPLALQPSDGRSSVSSSPLSCESRSEEHTSELQSRFDLVCRLLLEKKK